jgi:hypothetical protein
MAMRIDDHKKAKARVTGTEVKTTYDLKRDRERAALESVGLRHRAETLAHAAETAKRPTKRPRRMAAE